MRHLLSILLAMLVILPASGRDKERITERGSSLFYRSWRYPVVEDAEQDTTKKMSVDSVAVVDSLPQDTTPLLDSIPQDALTEHLASVDSLDKDDSMDKDAGAKAGSDKIGETDKNTPVVAVPNGEDDNATKVARPDINTCIVYFIFDQSNFITDYKAEFDTIMAFIDYHKGKNFEVVGHTDERGTVAYNQGLSERRAKKVFDVLVGRGVDPKRLTRIGRSELELAIPHAKNEREHLLNRRVVVRVKE